MNNVICTSWKGKSMRRYLVATVMSLTLLSSISAAIAEDSTTINTADAAATSAKAVPATIAADKSAPATTSTTTAPTETAAPAAKSEKKEPKEPKEPKAVKADKGAKKASSSSGGGVGAVPGRLASFAVGTMVGIPVSMFRKSKEESINATKDLVGDTDNKFIIAPAGLLGVPAGVLSGTMQGIVFGIKNAWTGSGDEPFSRESFSLGEK